MLICKIRTFALIFAVIFCTELLFLSPLHAQERKIPYDKYVDDINYEEVKEKFSILRLLSRLPAVPIEITKTVVKKPLIYLEEHHAVEKIEYIFRDLGEHGIYPSFKGSGGGGASFGGDIKIDVDRFLNMPDTFAKMGMHVHSSASINGYQKHGGGFKIDKIFSKKSYITGDFSYKHYAEEDFFGLGPKTSLGNGVTYKQEENDYMVKIGNKFTDTLQGEAAFRYQDIEIFDGNDDGKSPIKQTYASRGLDGLNGAYLFSETLSLFHDTRDNKYNPHSGGYEKVGFGYHNDAEDSFRYFKYKIDIVRFFPVYHKKITIALRASSEFNDDIGGKNVPFFDISRLGGYETLPGFQNNRFYDKTSLFFNTEYRYNIWKWKKWGIDAALGFGMGQVFPEINKVQMKNFKKSYGIALRSIYKDKLIAGLGTGLSNEGAKLYFKFKAPF